MEGWRNGSTDVWQFLKRAWFVLPDRSAFTARKLIFVQLALALFSSQNCGNLLGMMKTLMFDSEADDGTWMDPQQDLDTLLIILRERLTPEAIELLSTILAALKDPSKRQELENLTCWREQPARPLPAHPLC